MNTDKIVEYVVIEDEEEQVKSKEGTPVLLPKGMQRQEPKEPDHPEVATTEEVEAADRGEDVVRISSGDASEDEDIFLNEENVEMKDDDRKWPGAKPNRRVKIEGEEVNEIDTLTAKKALKKAEEKAKALKKKFKDPEDQLAAENLAFQRRLFGVSSGDEDGDSDIQEARAPRKPAIIDGNLYMFQFPPFLPPLHIVERTQQARALVKDEPNDDAVMLDAPAHSSERLVDLTANDNGDANVKQEEGAGHQAARGPEEQPEGFVGKLIIRKSGKMQIDYGGMLFDCESGIPVEFLRTAVLTEMDDEKRPDGYAGTAYGMGQITGKFVAVPRWSEEDEWNVGPDELPPNGIGAAEEHGAGTA
jgi:DNA-directed RNA polymerase III subunit RPC4